MNTIATPNGDLNPKVIDGILADIGRSEDIPVVLDMGSTTFITPYGVAMLFNAIRYLSGIAKQVYVAPPKAPEVRAYLWRIAFFERISIYCDIIADDLPPYTSKTKPSDAVLELSKVGSEDDVLMILHRLNGLLKGGLGYSAKVSLTICTMVSELCQNIPQHSGDWGVVCSQLYGGKSSFGERWGKIGVSDIGLGIKASLAGSLPDNCTDAAAILAAMELGVSRLGEIGRGQGLARVKEAVLRLNGRLIVRSGTARVLFGSAAGSGISDPMIFRGAYFRGTHIGIELPGINV